MLNCTVAACIACGIGKVNARPYFGGFKGDEIVAFLSEACRLWAERAEPSLRQLGALSFLTIVQVIDMIFWRWHAVLQTRLGFSLHIHLNSTSLRGFSVCTKRQSAPSTLNTATRLSQLTRCRVERARRAGWGFSSGSALKDGDGSKTKLLNHLGLK